jgi:hypothetical protein
MATPTEQIVPCPRCGHAAEIIDRKVTYRVEERSDTGTVRQFPASTAYTYHCLKDGCGHIFTRSVKH